MSENLVSKIIELDQQLDALFQQLQGYSYEELNRAPAPGKWSATQVMHHVMLAEHLSLKYCQKKLSFKPKLKKAGLRAFLRKTVLNGYLSTSFKFKAPEGLETPPPEDTLEQVIDQWRTQRSELRQFLKELPPQYLDKEVYKHPITGRLSWEGMLSFFLAHYQHHLPQILRAVKSA